MSTSSTTTPFACRGRSEPESPRSSRNDMRSTNGSPPARCGSSASRIPFTGWSLGSSSRSLAVMCRSSATTTRGRSRDSSRSLLLRLLFFAAGVIGFLLRGLLRFLLLDHRRPDAPRGLKPFALRDVGDALDLDLHAEEEIGPDRRSSRSRFRGEEFRVDFVHPAEVLEILEIHGRREDVVEARARSFHDLPEVLQCLPGLEPDVTLEHFAIRAQRPLPRDEDEVAELHAPGKGQSNRREIGLDRFFVHGPPVPPSPVMRVDDPIPCARVYGRGGAAFLASTFRSGLAGCVLIAKARLAPSRSRSLRFVSGPPSEE